MVVPKNWGRGDALAWAGRLRRAASVAGRAPGAGGTGGGSGHGSCGGGGPRVWGTVAAAAEVELS